MARIINFYIPVSYQRKIHRQSRPGSLGKIIPFTSASRRQYRSTVALESGERYRVTIGSPSPGILSLFSGKL
jgi:hypothetical protein